jgi:hypothetical protein
MKYSYRNDAFCNIFLRCSAYSSLGCLDKDICIHSCISTLPTFSRLWPAISTAALAVRKHHNRGEFILYPKQGSIRKLVLGQ